MLKDKNVQVIKNHGKYDKKICPLDLSLIDKLYLHKLKNKVFLLFRCGLLYTINNTQNVEVDTILDHMANNKITLDEHHICLNPNLYFAKNADSANKERANSFI